MNIFKLVKDICDDVQFYTLLRDMMHNKVIGFWFLFFSSV